MGVPVLVEGFVVASVCGALAEAGWQVTPVAATHTQGVDITASRDGVRLLIEAKGAGSSKVGTSRYGMSFTSGQVEISVGAALYKALGVESPNRAGVALPDTAPFHTKLGRARLAKLVALGIAVFWVGEDGTVTTEPDLGYLTS